MGQRPLLRHHAFSASMWRWGCGQQSPGWQRVRARAPKSDHLRSVGGTKPPGWHADAARAPESDHRIAGCGQQLEGWHAPRARAPGNDHGERHRWTYRCVTVLSREGLVMDARYVRALNAVAGIPALHHPLQARTGGRCLICLRCRLCSGHSRLLTPAFATSWRCTPDLSERPA